jgi:hypothetical protein
MQTAGSFKYTYQDQYNKKTYKCIRICIYTYGNKKAPANGILQVLQSELMICEPSDDPLNRTF